MNKQERAYTVIRQRILEGTYGPGHRLVIDAVARELGISTVPVREAIRRLEAEGWIVYRPHTGAVVAPVDAREWEATMSVLAVLEGYASAQAAGQMEPADLDRLREINAGMEQALRNIDVMTFSRLNREFHFTIYRRCSNGYLVELLQETWDRLDRIRRTIFQYIPHRGWDSIQEHARLIEMYEHREPPEIIERFAREHKLHTVEAYRKSLAPDTTRPNGSQAFP